MLRITRLYNIPARVTEISRSGRFNRSCGRNLTFPIRIELVSWTPTSFGGHVMRYIALAFMVALAGCTHVGTIQSENVRSLSEKQARTGVNYALPMIQYDVSLVRMLDKCDYATLTPEFAVSATASHRYVEGERFEVDPTSLSSMFKTTSLAIERYEDQNTLKALNAEANDKTGDALAAVARVGIAVAGMAYGLPIAPVAFGESPALVAGQPRDTGNRRQRIVCTSGAMQALKNIDDSIESLKVMNADLAGRDAEIARRKAVAELKSYPQESILALVELSERQIELANEIYATQQSQLVLKEALSFPLQKITWPFESAKSAAAQPLEYIVPFSVNGSHAERLCKLFVLITEKEHELDGRKFWVPNEAEAGDRSPENCAAVNDIALQSSQVRLALKPEASVPYAETGKVAMSATVATEAMNKGIYYRDPVRGRLYVETQDASREWKWKWKDEPQWIPQLGDLRFLPMESGPFENEVLSLSLRRDGRIEKFGYETKDAAFARAAKSAADVTEKVQAELEEQRKTERDNEKYLRETAAAVRLDEIAKIQARLDLLKKQRELLNEQDADAIAYRLELANLNAEIVRLTAQIAQLKLTNDLEEQRAKAAAD